MSYEIYKQKLDKESYFTTWENIQDLTDQLKEVIYLKYLAKCESFARDSFTCQQKDCNRCNNEQYYEKLTVHHIKAKRNGGSDKSRNMITLCNSIHQSYEKGKIELMFNNSKHLPAHIRGKSFKYEKLKKVNWKQVKAEMKIFRKTLRDQCGLKLTWEEISILMKFLNLSYEELID